MQESLFIEYIKKYYPGLVARIVSELTDPEKGRYFHMKYLRKVFDPSGKWESLMTANSNVAADVVALDASLPLKTRKPLKSASGDLPKIGLELKAPESLLLKIITMRAMGRTESEIVSLIFEDTKRVIAAVYEKIEAMFLQGLSTGQVLTVDGNANDPNVGLGVRISYGLATANQFGAATAIWGAVNSDPMADIARVKAAATGVTHIFMDATAYGNMTKSQSVKDFYGSYLGIAGGTVVPSREKLQQAINGEFGLTLEIVDRPVNFEENGTVTAVRPWADGRVVMASLPDGLAGTLTHGPLAEDLARSEAASYEKADGFILVRKYRTVHPALAEFTSAQASAVPVISANRIWTIDTKTVQA